MPRLAPADPTIESLRAEFAVIRDSAQGVAAKCLLAADELEATGAPPGDDFFEAVTGFQTRIEQLKSSLSQEWTNLGGIHESRRAPSDFAGFEQDLHELEQVRRERFERAQLLHRATTLLDAILALQHADDAAFAPLLTAQAAALQRKHGFDGESSPELMLAARELLERRDPLSALVEWIACSDALDDARWSALQDIVTQHFGRALAAAIARGRVRLPEAEQEAARRALSEEGCPEFPAPRLP